MRRSDQGKGAKEPDLVFDSGCPCWMELQNAADGAYNPEGKLAQAERDIQELNSDLWPVAICRKTGSPKIEVCTRLWVLLMLMGLVIPNDQDEGQVVVKFDYQDLLGLLTLHYRLNQ